MQSWHGIGWRRTDGAPVLGATVLWLIAALLAACSVFSPDEPSVDDETLVQVLTELHLVEARATREDTSVDPALRDSVFTHYGVTEEQVDAAIEYYSDRPSAYESIYEAVTDSLRTGQDHHFDQRQAHD